MNNESYEREKWILFNPDNIPSCSALCVDIAQNKGETKFTVECESQIIELKFECHVPVYVFSDEGIRMATYMPVQKSNDDKFYFKKWFLYKIENSRLIDWAVNESYGLYQNYGLQHFCIVTQNEIVDVLSTAHPKIVVRNK